MSKRRRIEGDEQPDYEFADNTANMSGNDLQQLIKALQYGKRKPSYRLRVPIGSAIDNLVRPSFGNAPDLDASAYANRRMYSYRGQGRYGTRMRKLRSSGLRLRSRRYRGRGMYMGGSGGYWGRKIGGFFGKADLGDKLGDIGGSMIRQFVPGGSLAMDAANAASRVYSGQGEYVNNSLVDGAEPIPTFNPTPDGSTVTISHREYIGDIYAPDSGALFQCTPFAVNPGIERTFPWLSQIAQNYDEYTLQQCMFSYRSTVADFASNSGQVGQVIMATIYNASSDPFADKAQMMQYDASMSCKTSESMVHGVECDPAKLSGPVGRFVRSNPVAVSQDVNNYDHGLFNIAVTETPSTYANQAMGELWVSYTVQLRKPKFFVNRGLGISRDVFACNQCPGTKQPFNFTTAPSALLIGQQNNIGCVLSQYDSANTVVVPTGAPALNCISSWQEMGPATAGTISHFEVTFPANYTGILRCTLHVAAPAGTQVTGEFVPYAQGNITRFYDTFGQIGAIWKNGCSAFNDANNAGGTSIQTFNIRVTNAANGIDNKIFFPFTGGHFQIDTAMLDISEMNAGLSYKQDGTKDQLVLVDNSGTVQSI